MFGLPSWVCYLHKCLNVSNLHRWQLPDCFGNLLCLQYCRSLHQRNPMPAMQRKLRDLYDHSDELRGLSSNELSRDSLEYMFALQHCGSVHQRIQLLELQRQLRNLLWLCDHLYGLS